MLGYILLSIIVLITAAGFYAGYKIAKMWTDYEDNNSGGPQ